MSKSLFESTMAMIPHLVDGYEQGVFPRGSILELFMDHKKSTFEHITADEMNRLEQAVDAEVEKRQEAYRAERDQLLQELRALDVTVNASEEYVYLKLSVPPCFQKDDWVRRVLRGLLIAMTCPVLVGGRISDARRVHFSNEAE